MAVSVTAQNRADVSNLYVALFGRAPDGEGLGYWSSQLANGTSLANVATAMFNVPAARAYYPSFATNKEIIDSFYLNVLGRAADTEGSAYWTAKLNAPSATPGSVITEIIAAVVNYKPSGLPANAALDAAGTLSKTLFLNKAAVALAYGLTNGSVAGAEIALNGVNATPASVTAALAAFNAGVTLSLTTGSDNLTGSSSDDIFKANVSQNDLGAQVNTLGSGDQLKGGGGSDQLLAKITAGAYINGLGNGISSSTSTSTSTGTNPFQGFFGEDLPPVTSNTITNGVAVSNSTMPIEPETKSIETVKFQAVEAGIVGQGNTQVYVNAKDMEDVTKLWSSRSDADLIIQNMTTKGLASLADQTLGMEYTGNADSRWGASDYTVYYDQDYLTAGKVDASSLEIRIVNNLELKNNFKGLVAFEKVSFDFTPTGGVKVLITVDITPAIRDLTNKAAYDALADAINAQLILQGIPATATVLDGRDAFFTDDLDGNPATSRSGTYFPIGIKAAGGILGKGQAAVDNTTLNFNGLNTQLQVSSQSDLLVTVNVALEKVGLAGDGGTFIAGSMNKTEDNIWKAKNTVVEGNFIGSTKSGIEKFIVSVGGDITKSSSLAGMHSTNNNLREVKVDSAATTVSGATFANLTIGNSNTVGYATDVQYDGKSYEVDRPDVDNQYALKDVKTFNAAGLKGNLYLTAALTKEVTAKYLNVIDSNTFPTAGNIDPTLDNRTDGIFTYTSGVGNDYINLYLDPANLAQPGTVTREDMSLVISTGLGNDEVLVGTGVYENFTFNGEGSGGSSGNPDWYKNQHINANLKMVGGVATGQLQINTGAGNDIVRTLGYGDYAVNAGDGLDTVYLDNTGTNEPSNSGTRANWTINDTNNDSSSLTSRSAATTQTKIANLFLNVSFKGYDAKVPVGGSNGSLTGVSVNDLTINQAIKAAINNDPVLNKLLIAEDGPGRTLIITSLIDGTQQDGNAFSDVVISLSTTTLSAQQLVAASPLSSTQAGVLGFSVATGTGFGASSSDRFNADLDLRGDESDARSDNLVVGGLGNDVLVLGTGNHSNDTVGYSGFGNGTDSIVNFTSQSTTTTVVDSATVSGFVQGKAATLATLGTADSFTLKLTGTVAVPTPGSFTLDTVYMGSVGDIVYTPTAGLTAAQVATGLAAANNAVAAASDYTAVATGDTVVFTQNGTAPFSNVNNPTLGNDVSYEVSYDGSGIGVVSLTGTTGSAPAAAAAATNATFTVTFGSDTVLPSTYSFDGVSVPVLMDETGDNIAASFASAFTVGATGLPGVIYDVPSYTINTNTVTFVATVAGPVVEPKDASFVGANIPNTTFGPTTFSDKLDFSSYAVKAVFVGATLVAGVTPVLGETYIQMTENTTNAGEYTMSQLTEAGLIDTVVGIIGIADFGATQPFIASNFVI